MATIVYLLLFLVGLLITLLCSFSQALLIVWVAVLVGYIIFSLQYKTNLTKQKKIFVFLPSMAGVWLTISVGILLKVMPGL
jgi:hypothetical protein